MTNVMPPPGLHGDYRGTCVVCLKPTDTALGFRGEAEWILAGLIALGVPEAQAYPTMLAIWRERDAQLADGQAPGGELTEHFRVCRACVRACGAPFPDPVVAIRGAAVPVVTGPPGG